MITILSFVFRKTGHFLLDRPIYRNFLKIILVTRIFFSEKPIVEVRTYYKPTKFDENRWSHFWENEFVFLMWTSLNFEGRSKTETRAGDICKGTTDAEFKEDWSGFRRYARWRTENKKKYFSSFRIFSGKTDNAILSLFQCTINPRSLIKIDRKHFW